MNDFNLKINQATYLIVGSIPHGLRMAFGAQFSLADFSPVETAPITLKGLIKNCFYGSPNQTVLGTGRKVLNSCKHKRGEGNFIMVRLGVAL